MEGMRAVASPPDALVARCIAGERQAWRELHATHYPVAYGFLRRLGVRPPETEDACQEVFVQIFRYLATFEQRADLKTWLYKLCISQAARVRRRAKLRQSLRWFLSFDAQATHAQGSTWSETEVQRRVHGALDRMKPIHRTVFVLFELEGMSGDDVAKMLRLPHATVRRRLHHARKEFHALIEAAEGTA
jgi:RNA polymerase sigma-70 factor (ECF subfamily)